MPQRLVDPSEFADTPTTTGPRQVDPSELADTHPTDTGHPWLAAGVRGLAGMLGVEGGWTGAGLAGLGETAAEALEQGTMHPTVNAARVATAAGMGAIPLASVFKAGAPIYSALRGGAQSAVGTGLNELAEGQSLDPKAIAMSGGIGAVTGGALSKVFGGKAAPAIAEAAEKQAPYGPFRKPPPVDVDPVTGQKTFRVPSEAIPKPVYPTPTPKPTGPQQYEYESDISKGLGKLLKPALSQQGADVAGLQSAVDQSTAQGAAKRAANFREAVGATKAEQAADAAWMRQQAAQSGELTPEEMADLISQRSPKANAPVGPPPTPSTSTPPMGATSEQVANDARAMAATSGVTEPNPVPKQDATRSLLKFFGGDNPRVDIPGQGYRAAKVDPTANPLATQQLGAALTHEASQAGLPTAGGTNFAKFLESKISPDIEGKFAAAEKSPMAEVPSTGGGPESPGISETPQVSGGQDWVQHQNDLIDGFNEYKNSILDKQGGFLSPSLLHQVLAPLTGAAIGAPVGAYMNQDDPLTGAMYGTAAGGMLGWYATAPSSKEAIDQLIQIRNAGMLMGPAQLKKHLSDLGAYTSNAFEQAMAGNNQLARNLAKEAFNPENIKNYLSTFKNTLQGQVPESAQAVIGDAATTAAERIRNSGLYERAAIAPIAAAQDATFKAMLRAGMSPEEAEKVLLLGNPTTPLGKAWTNLQSLPGASGQIVRTIRPFARIATNLAERGLERTPGIGALMPGENKFAKQAIGLGAMGIGAGVGMYDKNQADIEEPTNPIMKGLRRAMFASYGLPFTAGEALGGADWTEVARMFPGMTLPPVQQGEAYPVTLGKQYVKQILPSWVLPDTGSAR